ncbi:hypothetical protein SLS58_006579 [Diplodia intermedia]|uniref:Pantothenate kinase n=1 Tax=Diplodia intermedia TaxID=856260 RepID=A0ABR3TMZ5_9PEZI
MSPSLSHDAAHPANRAHDDPTIRHPGNVYINVQGAFIVDDEPRTPESPESDYEHEHGSKDIRLPNHTAVVSHIAVDVSLPRALRAPISSLTPVRMQIGGSLAKLVYFSRDPTSKELGGRLNFLKFETARIDECIDFLRKLKLKYEIINGSRPSDLCVMATGGGAFKYYDEIKGALEVEVVREDEMECLIIGLDFFITEIPHEVFTYSQEEPMRFIAARPNIYPYLLVNIGSGVSMVKVSGPRQYERVGGTSLGGGTLWGLLSLLTGARTFEDMLSLAERGDNTAVDMLVGDIYGSGYGKIGLKSTTIASSFGKVYKMKRQAEQEAEDTGNLKDSPYGYGNSFKPEDVSKSLLYAVSNNIGQIAYLHAEKHNLEHIYFGGSFIGGHPQTMHTLSYAIKFWSKGEKQAYFLRHEGYLGSVGAFLKRQPRNWGRRNSVDGRPATAASSSSAEEPTKR